jgi:hypothetical protein
MISHVAVYWYGGASVSSGVSGHSRASWVSRASRIRGGR